MDYPMLMKIIKHFAKLTHRFDNGFFSLKAGGNVIRTTRGIAGREGPLQDAEGRLSFPTPPRLSGVRYLQISQPPR